MALGLHDRKFRDKYRGKSIILSNAQFPQQQSHAQQQYSNIRKKHANPQDAILAEKVTIFHGSIVDNELIGDIEAVILPGNERLWADGTGVSGAIFNAAGYDKLQKACNAITDEIDGHNIPNGQSVLTKGFDLKVNYIIHVIAPCEQSNEDLISCYISALELCVKMGIRNVAFPCVGTGDGNFSKQSACSTALRAVRGWLSDANNVRYEDFMTKSRAAKPLEWQTNIDLENDSESEEDIYAINDETVCDRIDNIVFCCFDHENWDLYSEMTPKIYPTMNKKHSYLWIDKIASMEYNCMAYHIQNLEMENKQLKNEESKENYITGFGLQQTLHDLDRFEQEFGKTYTTQKITKTIEKSPKKLMDIKNSVRDTLNCLQQIKARTDLMIENVESIHNLVQTISTSNTLKYKQWNISDIIVWILSLENGRFAAQINQIKDGLIASEIICGDTLPELTRSDLSVPPFSINSFQVKRDLIQHFQSLKNVSEGDGNTETYT